MMPTPIRKFHGAAWLTAAILAASPAAAVQIFHDDFDSEAGGSTAIFQQSLTNWTITGYVDVIGTDNTLGYTVPSTVIDLGGGLTGGFMKTKQSFSYGAGETVRISWDMSGNQIRPLSPDIPYMQFYFAQTHPEQFQEVAYLKGGGFFSWVDFEPWDGSGYFRLYDYFFAYGDGLYGDYPFTRQWIEFVPRIAGAFQFELGTYSGGGYGPLIDNFSVDVSPTAAVPEPATWALLIAGFGMVGAAARRRTRNTVTA